MDGLVEWYNTEWSYRQAGYKNELASTMEATHEGMKENLWNFTGNQQMWSQGGKKHYNKHIFLTYSVYSVAPLWLAAYNKPNRN